MKPDTMDVIRIAMEQERKAVAQLIDSLDQAEYAKAVDILLASTMTVTSACGSSGFTTQKFAHALCCIESPAKFVSPADLYGE